MLIALKGDFDIDKAITDLKSKAKNNMTDIQFSKCEHIIEKAVIRFSKAVTYTTWANAFAIFQISKTLIGRYMIHSIERVFVEKLTYTSSKETLEKAWSEFSDRYKIKLDTRFGYMPDVMWSRSKYYTAVGWIIAGWLSPQKTPGEQAPESSEAVKLYKECRKNPSSGMSGFHGFGSSGELPFSTCGWATFDGEWGGVAFRINRDCFDGRDAVLYYMDDDFFGDLPDYLMEWLKKVCNRIEKYSSGLTDVQICEQTEQNDFMFRGHLQHPTRVTTIRFRLDSSKIKETVEISEKPVPTSELGEYIFVLPRAGEFYIELGEIVDGKRVPLHYDDFCMK